MKSARYFAAAVTLALLLWAPAGAQESGETQRYRAAFEGIVRSLNENSFDQFNRAIVKKDMVARIAGNRLIDPDVMRAFSSDFAASLQQMFIASFPKSNSEILATLVDFDFDGQRGRAVVRYAASGYRYSYHVYELQPDTKGRLVIVDWVDYYRGGRFSDEAGATLVMAMPTRAAARNLLDYKKLDDGEIFQVTELFKAVRDNKPDRFFQIADGLRGAILSDKTISRLALRMALTKGDGNRIEKAVQVLSETYPDDALNSLRLIEYYIPRRQYEATIAALGRLQAGIGVEDGASESLKASAALANGDVADAISYARQATIAEPGLELPWWTLLRAATRGEDYAAATEALTRLEDGFGHSLTPATLRRDPFLKVLADKQEYLDWRETRE